MSIDDMIRSMIRYELAPIRRPFSDDDPNPRITELMRQREQDRKKIDELEMRIEIITDRLYVVADAARAKV